jgi:excinuclease ABC subunit A
MKDMADNEWIRIRGAAVNNLKQIDVDIPRNRFTVITGLSGSGKSSLAFDTLFAEGQRRFAESISSFARQFLGRMAKPAVDSITGIPPAIAIEQKVNTRNPRSTVGTTTEIYVYLRLLFARIGHTYSPVSGREVVRVQAQDIVAHIASLPEGERVLVAAPLVVAEGQGVVDKITLPMGEGVQRFRYRGEVLLAEDLFGELDTDAKPAEIEIVVDRLKATSDKESLGRIGDSVSRALEIGDGVCRVITPSKTQEFCTQFEADGITFEQPTEHLFSFN